MRRFRTAWLALVLALAVPTFGHTVFGQTLALGAAHACALLSGGTVKCWGANRYGQLGLGDTQARGDQSGEMGANLPVVNLPGTPSALVAGAYHTCAMLAGGTVTCWGSNTDGQLGLGDTQARGDQPGEMGANLPVVPLGGTALALSAGAYHTCAVLLGGTVKCWGANRYGQLGLGDTQARGDQSGEMGANLPVVSLAGAVAALAAGGDHTCALLKTGAVQCWGYNGYGQLGYNDTQARGDQSGEMGVNLPQLTFPGGAATLVAGADHACALVSSDGSVRCWGRADRGQTGQGTRTSTRVPTAVALPMTVQTLAAGGDRSCATLADASLRCWGANAFGELGLGTTADWGDESGEMGANLPQADLAFSADDAVLGMSHVCAHIQGGIQCWGSGANGRLGTGQTVNIGDQAGEMGMNLPFVDFGVSLPVELVGWRATLDGRRARLAWETVSETNNAGFTVEHDAGAGVFQAIARVAGHGTTLERNAYAVVSGPLATGLHRFRLVQHDLDGQVTFSPVVELAVSVDEVYDLAAAGPEPFSMHTRYRLAVATSQRVVVTLYDALGRPVQHLADAQLEADAPVVLEVDGSALAPGTYLLWVVGDRFTTSRTLTRAR
ncbi:MAG: hypothetical protein LCH53_02240 [Bacteroidetes bacterium]|nr:hypothetical protein [Bacteroidota bacterium]